MSRYLCALLSALPLTAAADSIEIHVCAAYDSEYEADQGADIFGPERIAAATEKETKP